MTVFNPDNKETLTYGDCLKPAMEITDKADAQQYLAAYTAHIQKYLDKNPRSDGMTAEDIALANIGYWAGYYSEDVRRQAQKLFGAIHPVFGDIFCSQ